MMFTKIHNLKVFFEFVCLHSIPPWRWGEAWRELQARHLAQIHKAIWQLKCEGKVLEDSEGRLFWIGGQDGRL